MCCERSLTLTRADVRVGGFRERQGSCEESWTCTGTTLLEMPTSVALPTSHHFHPSLSPVVSFSLGILHEWMRTQMLAKPSLNQLQRTRGDHRGGRAQPGWRTFMITCLRWISGNVRLEIWRKIGLSGEWRLVSLQSTIRTRSRALHANIGLAGVQGGGANDRTWIRTAGITASPMRSHALWQLERRYKRTHMSAIISYGRQPQSHIPYLSQPPTAPHDPLCLFSRSVCGP